MTDILLRMLAWATVGLALVLLLRRTARRLVGAGPAFTLWLLPVVLALAPLLPRQLAPTPMVVLPGLMVAPHAHAVAAAGGVQVDGAWLCVALWLAGVGIGLARLGWIYARLRAGARPGAPAWLTTVAAAAPGLDLRRVRMHPAGPAVLWAFPHSWVLVPEDFALRFGNAATRGLVLRHELTHARRGDAWWSLAMEIASALLWFHPLAWLARARFRLDQELACDAAALRALPQGNGGYARALLDSAAVQPVPALIPWLAEPQLKERMLMITRIPPGTLRRRVGFLAIAALLAGGVIVAGSRTPVQAATRAVSSSAPPEVDATWKNAHPPQYPVAAVQKGEQGEVMLDVTIDAGGTVTKVTVDPSATTAPSVLQSAAVAAAANWKFRPGIKDGKPVAGVVRIPVNFSLHDVGAAGSSAATAPSRDHAGRAPHPSTHPTAAVKSRPPLPPMPPMPRMPPMPPMPPIPPMPPSPPAPASPPLPALPPSPPMPPSPPSSSLPSSYDTVMLRLQVDASGRVLKAIVDQAKSTTKSRELQAAAVGAAQQWKLTPATKDGQPVAGWVMGPVRFSLPRTQRNEPA